MNLQILRDIAKELDSLDVSDATRPEANIAELLINAGLLSINPCYLSDSARSKEPDWKEYKTT